MSIEWDIEKARINLKKHGIAFSEAVTALEDPYAITIEDEHPDESRYITLGMDAAGILMVVVYTFRQDAIRIISARKATVVERQAYLSGGS